MSEVVARLDYIERALFGKRLTVAETPRPVRPERSHECIASIVPLVEQVSLMRQDWEKLAKIIEAEAENLKRLRRLKKT